MLWVRALIAVGTVAAAAWACAEENASENSAVVS